MSQNTHDTHVLYSHTKWWHHVSPVQCIQQGIPKIYCYLNQIMPRPMHSEKVQVILLGTAHTSPIYPWYLPVHGLSPTLGQIYAVRIRSRFAFTNHSLATLGHKNNKSNTKSENTGRNRKVSLEQNAIIAQVMGCKRLNPHYKRSAQYVYYYYEW